VSEKETAGFIGAGNMAEALIKGFTASKALPPSRIFVSDRLNQRLVHMAETLGVKILTKNYEVARNADIIFIAVKPSDAAGVLREIAPELNAGKLLVSIAAGITTGRVMEALEEGGLKEVIPVVRAMPNTPVTIREGVTALVAGAGAGKGDLAVAGRFFSTVGGVVYIEDEALMDAVTGLSGSGPAYIFYIMEALIEAGAGAGMTAEQARTLVIQTTIGAARLAAESGVELKELRERVTSPGGTTAEGIRVFEEAGLGDIIIRAVRAAERRSRELSGQR